VSALERFSLAGKVAVVTGAAGLLGRRHCHALAEAGARVVATDLGQDQCDDVASELGPGAVGVAADVSDPTSVRALTDELIARHGRIDVLVNNAAINDKVEDPAAGPDASRFENFPLDRWQRSLDVNVTGPFLCCQTIGAVMAEAGRGSIVNLASTYAMVAPDQSLYRDAAGHQRFYKSPVYPATKAAVLALTRFLAAYWGPAGIRVNALSPGGVENGQDDEFIAGYSRRTPLGRMAAPGDFEGALIFLASDASAYVNGANLVADGGYTIW
jgi:NAD(P)-dependent dehydrogenase (short-subunit alcohol dehydrogenase family)